MEQTQQNDVTLRIGAVLTNLNKELNAARVQVRRAFASGSGIEQAAENFNKVDAKVRNLTKAFKPARLEFQGWALSIMFFGMALQRTFNGIWKSASKTFTEVMASTNDAANGFTMLQGSMKYLQFSVGQALEPLALSMIPIIDRITEIVQKNPELTRGIVGWGMALGAIFTVGGGAVLAINGFAELGAKMGWYTQDVHGALKATEGFSATLKALRVMAGIGILVGVGLKVFGSTEPPTMEDWLTNLGMSAAGGWMVGGPWGALAAAAVTLVVMLSKEDARRTLKNVEFIRDTTEKLMSGMALNLEEAIAINWQGTVVPDYVQKEQQRKLEESVVKAGIGNQAIYDLKYGSGVNQTMNFGKPQEITIQIDSDVLWKGALNGVNDTVLKFE